MPQTIKLKRSAVQGNIPTIAQLELGEIGINNVDGKVFIKKDNNNYSSSRDGTNWIPGTSSGIAFDTTGITGASTFYIINNYRAIAR